MIKRIKAVPPLAGVACFIVILVMVVSVCGVAIEQTFFPLSDASVPIAVEDGGTITMSQWSLGLVQEVAYDRGVKDGAARKPSVDRLIKAAFIRGYECGRKPSGSDLTTRGCADNGCSAQQPPATPGNRLFVGERPGM